MRSLKFTQSVQNEYARLVLRQQMHMQLTKFERKTVNLARLSFMALDNTTNLLQAHSPAVFLI